MRAPVGPGPRSPRPPARPPTRPPVQRAHQQHLNGVCVTLRRRPHHLRAGKRVSRHHESDDREQGNVGNSLTLLTEDAGIGQAHRSLSNRAACPRPPLHRHPMPPQLSAPHTAPRTAASHPHGCLHPPALAAPLTAFLPITSRCLNRSSVNLPCGCTHTGWGQGCVPPSARDVTLAHA